MTASPRNEQPNGRPRKRRVIGSASSILLIGFLAGMFTGNTLPSSAMVLATSVTVIGLLTSVIVSKVTQYLTVQSERKACDRAISDLERRMERLIPRRRVIAHGTHSHSPNYREESECDWIPVTRRSRTKSSSR